MFSLCESKIKNLNQWEKSWSYEATLSKPIERNESQIYMRITSKKRQIAGWRLIRSVSVVSGLLPVSLYGVAAVQASGVDWLKSNCINREVWFQLFSTNEKNQLDCVIKLKRVCSNVIHLSMRSSIYRNRMTFKC